MNRTGFVPYGPARAGAEALSRIMAADLDGTGVTVNILLPGGATATGMIPDDFPPENRGRLLDPAIMGPPTCFLVPWPPTPPEAAPPSPGGAGRRPATTAGGREETVTTSQAAPGRIRRH
jgi:NAD(P)-dependent dehydrogenase (short-subunit alcohol dehydrogenase family)